MMFSIIIPVYNVEQYLRDCLDSVLHQSFADWEAICVDDGSTDTSAAILDEIAAIDPRVIVVTQSNGGLSSARNAGLEVAKGDYLLFLDSDDWLEPEALKTLSDHLDGEDMLCFSGRRFVEATRTFNPPDPLTEKTYGSGMEYYTENALLQRDFAFVCVVLRAYRRMFLLENHLCFKEGVFHEDNLFTPMACYYARTVKILNECLYNYRVRYNSITATSDLRHASDLMGIANVLASFFISKQGFDKTVVYRAITHHYQVAFERAAKKEERKELSRLCDWQLYCQVSRTKLRHQMNHLINRIKCY